MTDELEKRRKLTFSQAEGLADLPRQLKREEMPLEFRNAVWGAIHRSIQGPRIGFAHPEVLPFWGRAARFLWDRFFLRPLDEFPNRHVVIKECKRVILEGKFNEVFDLLTALSRFAHVNKEPIDFSREINLWLRKCQMAYHLDTSGLPTFMPISTQEEGEAVLGAMQVLADTGMDGARMHLRKAAEAINQNQFEDAVRESINAVESVAKVVSGGEKQTLVDALKVLEKRGLLSHPALSAAFQKLYGYTSDEKGVRHAHAVLEEGAANVGEEEALFMFGACASFCGYLCRKQRKMGK